MIQRKAVFALLAVITSFGAATAQQPDMAAAAKAIQAGCVKRGEDARVCACGVGLSYAKLDPKVFVLIPRVEPLLDEKDKAKATMGLIAAASGSGLAVPDLQRAYDSIRANRTTVREICKPLAGK